MKTETAFEITHHCDSGEYVLSLRGGLLAPSLPQFRAAMTEAEKSGAQAVHLDLKDLEIVDSKGLGTFVEWFRHFSQRDIDFRFLNVNGAVLRSLQLTNLTNLLNVTIFAEDPGELALRQRHALWGSHEYIEQIMLALGEGVVGLGVDGEILFMNPSAEKLLGRGEDELLGRSFVSSVDFFQTGSILDRNFHSPILDVAMGLCKVHRAEIILLTKAGIRVPCQLIATSIQHHGAPAGAIVGLTDLSEREQVSESLRNTYRRYQELVQNTGDLVYTTDLDGRISFASPALLKTLEYPFKDIARKKETLLIKREDRDLAQEYQETRIESKPASPLQCELQARSGARLPVEIISNPIYGPGGDVEGLQSIVFDISHRKRTEQALKASEKRLRAIAEHCPEAVIFYRMIDGQVEYVNPACEALSEYPLEEFYAPNPPQLSHPEEQQAGFTCIGRCMKGEHIPFRESRVITKSGKIKWVETAYVPLFEENSAQFGFMSITRDISERKQAYEALGSMLARFESVVQSTPMVAIQGFDREGKVALWNRASESFYGYTAEEAVGKTLETLFANPAEYSEFKQGLESAWIAGRPCEAREWRIRARDGEYRWVYSTLFPILENNQATEMFCMDVDITERKNAEIALSESEDRYRRMLGAVTSYTFSMDKGRNGSKTIHSEGSTAILGWTPQELDADPGITSKMLHHEDAPGVLQHFQRIMAGEKVSPINFRIHHRGGSIRWLRLTTASCLAEDGSLSKFDGLVEDITDHRRMEEELRQAQKMESVGQLAGGIAHDFNNLLTGILGNLSLVEIDAAPATRQLLHEAQKAGQRAADLVQKLLAFSRKSQVTIRPTNLKSLVGEVAGFARETFDKRIEIELRQAPDLLPVMGDAVQLHQVLLNLCVNARDSLDDAARMHRDGQSKIIIETHNVVYNRDFRPGAVKQDSEVYVEISVSDTGMGMDAETKKRIFDPFYTTKEGRGGTGLGLASVYGIVKQHEGWINVYSELGKSATFKVYLPAAPDGTAIATTRKEHMELPRGTETILLVDDEEMIRVLGKAILTRLGYQVLLAANGKEGLDVYRANREKIALTVLDISMPVLSGIEALAQIRADCPDAKVILSSGYSDAAIDETASPQIKPSDFVSKPYRPTDLARAVRQVLDGSSEQ